jgi:hypothetical protein
MMLSFVLLLTWGVASAQQVEIRGGNVYVKLNGVERTIADTGLDSDASISPDHTEVVFVRQERPQVAGQNGLVKRIMIANLNGSNLKEVFVGFVEIEGRKYYDLRGPQFAPDKKHIYFFLGDYGATTSAVIELNIAMRRTRFVTTGLNLTVVPSGRYAGDLIVQQRRPKLGVGYYYWFYLFSPSGEELGVVGDNQQDVENFFATYAL